MKKKLYRSRDDQMICGVCSGIANYLGIDPTVVRVITAVAAIAAGTGVLAYIVCAIIMPEEPEDAANEKETPEK